MKQEILYWKKQLGWDRATKVTYSEDFTNDVRQHQESLKAMASRAQHSDYTVKMAGNRIIIDNISYGYDDLDTAPSELRDAIPKKKNVKGGLACRGKECFLSNFYPANIKIAGKQYVNVEQFFQHQKCLVCGDYIRAAKILLIDDPVQIKSIGDSCTEKEEWLNVRIETLFKAVFYKFTQNRALSRKLLATGDVGLYEATTDRFYGCGLGYNSKRWSLGDWTGKNVAGKIVMRVREILKEKLNEGLDLSSLSFNYSPPSFRHERAALVASRQLRPPAQSDSPLGQQQLNPSRPEATSPHPVFTAMDTEQPELIPPGDGPHMLTGNNNMCEIGRTNPSTTQQGIEQQIGELSALLESIKAREGQLNDRPPTINDNGNNSQMEQSMYTTVHNWSSHCLSHSLPRSQHNVKQRNNPNRGVDSLTHHERDYIFRTEEDNPESNFLSGYDRAYGRGSTDVDAAINRLTSPVPLSSTPCPGGSSRVGTQHSYLHKKLSSEKGTSPIIGNYSGIRRKTVRAANIQDI